MAYTNAAPCSQFTFNATSPGCQTYSLHEGCSGSGTCAGTVSVTGGNASHASTPAFTPPPSMSPSMSVSPSSFNNNNNNNNNNGDSDGTNNINLAPFENIDVILPIVFVVMVLLTYYVYSTRRFYFPPPPLSTDAESSKEGQPSLVIAPVNLEFWDLYLLPISFMSGLLNALLIPVFLSTDELVLASLVIVIRAGVFCTSLYLIFSMLRMPLLSSLVPFSLRFSNLWSAVCIFSIFDPSVIRLFPFIATDFANRSRGYPTFRVFNIAMYAQLVTSIASVIVASVGISRNVNVFNIFSMGLSFVTFLMHLFSFTVKTISEKIQDFDVDIVLKRNNSVDKENKNRNKNNSLSSEDNNKTLSMRMMYETMQRDREVLRNQLAESDKRTEQELQNAVRMHEEKLQLILSNFEKQELKSAKNLQKIEMLEAELHNYVISDEEERVERLKASINNAAAIAVKAERKKQFDSAVPHCDETQEVLKLQLQAIGEAPLQFFPLQELQGELGVLISKMNSSASISMEDERHIDYLLRCLQVHPEYREEKEELRRVWLEKARPFAADCLEIMLSWIPPSVFSDSIEDMTSAYEGLSKPLGMYLYSNEINLYKLNFYQLNFSSQLFSKKISGKAVFVDDKNAEGNDRKISHWRFVWTQKFRGAEIRHSRTWSHLRSHAR